MKTETTQHHLVAASEEGLRLDRWFRRHFDGVPYSHFANLCRRALVRLDGAKTNGSTRLKSGQRISLPVMSDMQTSTEATQPLPPGLKKQLLDSIIHQDEEMLALNKPCGLATQGGSGVRRHIDQLVSIFAEKDEPPRLVHRLDKGTSGVLLLARNVSTASQLAGQFRTRAIVKTYWAVCHGTLTPSHGIIDVPLPLDDKDKDKVKQATTYYVTLKAQEGVSLLALRPVSGRKHQLRRHCALLGHPILGETRLFDGVSIAQHRRTPHKKLHLHARSLTLRHPTSNTVMTLYAEPPSHIIRWCQPDALATLDQQAETRLGSLAQ